MAFVFVAGIKVELCCYLFEEKEDCRQSGDLCEFEKVILNFNGLRLRWDFIHVMVPTLAQKNTSTCCLPCPVNLRYSISIVSCPTCDARILLLHAGCILFHTYCMSPLPASVPPQ